MDETQNDASDSDHAVFRSVAGGPAVEAWFGFVPSFHDASIEKLELQGNSAVLVIRAFRITSRVDAAGYFVCDRNALVRFHLGQVSGVALEGIASGIILSLAIRRLTATGGEWKTAAGPAPGDWEVRWESSYGLEGALYARQLELVVEPT